MPADQTAIAILPRLALLAVVGASFALYHAFNRPRATIRQFVTAADRALPLVPALAVPYLLYFPFLLFTAGYGILGTPRALQVAASYLAAQIVALTIYAAFQTHVPRPPLAVRGPFERLVALIYRIDRPYNTLPSLHVAHSLLSAFWWTAFFAPFAGWAWALAALIAAATLFLKQHVIVDVLAGAALAAFAAGVGALMAGPPLLVA
jgi:membrane-associated phospholipid phosphatase